MDSLSTGTSDLVLQSITDPSNTQLLTVDGCSYELSGQCLSGGQVVTIQATIIRDQQGTRIECNSGGMLVNDEATSSAWLNQGDVIQVGYSAYRVVNLGSSSQHVVETTNPWTERPLNEIESNIKAAVASLTEISDSTYEQSEETVDSTPVPETSLPLDQPAYDHTVFPESKPIHNDQEVNEFVSESSLFNAPVPEVPADLPLQNETEFRQQPDECNDVVCNDVVSEPSEDQSEFAVSHNYHNIEQTVDEQMENVCNVIQNGLEPELPNNEPELTDNQTEPMVIEPRVEAFEPPVVAPPFIEPVVDAPIAETVVEPSVAQPVANPVDLAEVFQQNFEDPTEPAQLADQSQVVNQIIEPPIVQENIEPTALHEPPTAEQTSIQDSFGQPAAEDITLPKEPPTIPNEESPEQSLERLLASLDSLGDSAVANPNSGTPPTENENLPTSDAETDATNLSESLIKAINDVQASQLGSTLTTPSTESPSSENPFATSESEVELQSAQPAGFNVEQSVVAESSDIESSALANDTEPNEQIAEATRRYFEQIKESQSSQDLPSSDPDLRAPAYLNQTPTFSSDTATETPSQPAAAASAEPNPELAVESWRAALAAESTVHVEASEDASSRLSELAAGLIGSGADEIVEAKPELSELMALKSDSQDTASQSQNTISPVPIPDPPAKQEFVEEDNSVAAVLARMNITPELEGEVEVKETLQLEEPSHGVDAIEAEPLAEPAFEESNEPVAEEESDDVQSYMNSLLQRLNTGTTEDKSTPPATSVKQPASEKVTSTVQEIPRKPQIAPLKAEEFVPKRVAPEVNSNMAAMRELANAATNSALTNSRFKKTQTTRTWLLTSAVSGVLGSVFFSILSHSFADVFSIIAMICALAGVVTGGLFFHTQWKAKYGSKR